MYERRSHFTQNSTKSNSCCRSYYFSSLLDCGSDYKLDHGSVDFDKTQTTYNQTVMVTCAADYEAVGTPVITCLQNGTWSQIVCQRSPAKGALNTYLLFCNIQPGYVVS